MVTVLHAIKGGTKLFFELAQKKHGISVLKELLF